MDIIIGRSAEHSNIIINDPNISRTHCTVRFDKKVGCFFIKDTSSNGTFSASGQRYASGTYSAVATDDKFYLSSVDFMIRVGLE